MGAVANNPEFAAEVGVPQSVGAEFMAKGKKKKRVRKYQFGGPAVGRDPVVGTLGQGQREKFRGQMLDDQRRMRPTGSPNAGIVDILGNIDARERSMATPRGSLPTIGAPAGPSGRPPTPRELRMDEVRNRPMGFRGEELTVEKKKKKKKKKKKSAAGGTIKSYYHGGKIRGCGKETQGRRKAKMIRMKGS